MPDQVGVTAKGGTMRLGKYPCVLGGGLAGLRGLRHTRRSPSATATAMSSTTSSARSLVDAGMRLAGTVPGRPARGDCGAEPKQNWFVGVQFHPEFKSRPNRPHPVFEGFVRAAIEK